MSRIVVTGLSGSEKGKEYSFDTSSILLGAGQNCDISFNPQLDRTVDISHARLVWREGRLWVEDAGSRHGVFIDGRRVSREMLRSDSVIELGRNGPRLKIQAPMAEPGGPNPKATGPSAVKRVVIPFGALALLAAIAVAVILLSNRGGSGPDSDEKLQNVAEQYREAVGLVVAAHRGKSLPVGTAWAVGPNLYATNAHVAIPALEVMAAGGTSYIHVNQRPDLKFRILGGKIHPKYNQPIVDSNGEAPDINGYDVALLQVDGTAPAVFKLAGRSKLEKLDSGHRIAFLGFPMEKLVGNGVSADSPVANMQSGIITSNTDYWLRKCHYEDRLLISHNLPTTGGASGSPVFDTDGDVVGVLFAMNIVTSLKVDPTTQETFLDRTPNAAQLNFAQRVSLLSELMGMSQ